MKEIWKRLSAGSNCDSVNFVEDPGRLQFTSDKKDEPKILSCSSVFYQERS